MSIEAMKQALEALDIGLEYAESELYENRRRYEGYRHLAPDDQAYVNQIKEAITSLRQALSEAQLSVNENSHAIEQAEKQDVEQSSTESKETFDQPVAWETRERFYEALDRAVEKVRQEMRVKTVTMRCKDYCLALPIVDFYGGHVLVGQVTLPAAQQEPVAWVEQDAIDWLARDERGRGAYTNAALYKQKDKWAPVPLYTTPLNPVDSIKSSNTLDAQPQREWVGLTDEEINDCDPQEDCWGLHEVARAIEAKLRSKNQ